MPRSAIAICRPALTQGAFRRAMDLAEVFTPEAALDAGFVDKLVQPGRLLPRAQEHALQVAELNAEAHAATKARTRETALVELSEAIETDAAEFRAMADASGAVDPRAETADRSSRGAP